MRQLRIVVTGVGCISPLGADYSSFSRNLLSAHCGIGPITLFETERCSIKNAAEVHGYDERKYFESDQTSKLDRFAQFALISAREAVTMAGLNFDQSLAERTAIVHGTGVGGHTTLDFSYHRIYGENASRLHPLTVPKLMFSSAVSHISLDLGIKGPAFATASACASSGHAIALSAMMLRAGAADVVITGGAEACITLGTMKGWEGLRVMSHDTCRPFSRDRGGMLIGEGAATLVLESLQHARARDAHIYAELIGVSMNSDAYHLVMPSPEGAERSLRLVLQDAGIAPSSVDYINAHGTGTQQNDSTEAAAIHRVFGENARKIAVSSSKSQFGHLLGAGAAMEALAVITALTSQTAPPTINYLGPSPDCDLDCVPNAARPCKIDIAISNSFAFGGLNTVLAFRRYTPAD
jgi:nodulation protein E